MKTFYKILPWALLIIAAVIIYNIVFNFWISNDEEVKSNELKKETLQKGIDTISVKQTDLADKGKDSARSYSNNGNNIIKVIYYEKKPIVLPGADSVDRFIAAYKFTE
jgi:hypothetical protein